MGRRGGSRKSAVTLFQQLGNVARNMPPAAYVDQRANNFPDHITQKRPAPNHISPFVSAFIGPSRLNRVRSIEPAASRPGDEFRPKNAAHHDLIPVFFFRSRRTRNRPQTPFSSKPPP